MSSSPLSSAQAARKALADQLDRIRRDAGLSGLELAVRCGWTSPSRPASPAVKARLKRSHVLHDAGHQFALILEEAVLYYGVCDAEALTGQLDHLLGISSLPNFSVGVIPFRARRTVWPLEAFYAFDESLVTETLTAEINGTAPGEIRTCLRAFAELAKIAVHGAEARSRTSKARSTLR